jgi:hypothetical protein
VGLAPAAGYGILAGIHHVACGSFPGAAGCRVFHRRSTAIHESFH